MPTVGKKSFREKSTENVFWAPSKKQNQRKLVLVDQYMQKKFNQLKETNKQLKFLNIQDGPLDAKSSYSSKLVTYKNKSS